MAVLGGRAIGLSSFPSSSSYLGRNSRATASSSSSSMLSMHILSKSPILRGYIPYSTVQESSRPTATAETKAAPASEAMPAAEAEPAADAERKEVKAAPKAAAKAKPKAAAKAPVKPLPQMMEEDEPAADAEKKEVKAAPEATAKAKPKAAAKAPVKPLPQMMEEDVIPSLKAILEAQEDLSEIQLSFKDNKLEGSFLKKGNPYSFWAFFPSGVLTGPKGFSLSSYGSEASTVEPFLVDEKKITAKHVVFWVEKRLAAQGIIPVWKED